MTPYLEIGGDYREIVPGLWGVELPLPFSLGLVNVWLIELDEGWMLVDSGMPTPQCEAALARALEGIGAGWTGLRHLLLTHFHPDHMGGAERILARSRARLWLHDADANMLAGLCEEERHHAQMREIYRAAGTPERLGAVIRRALAAMHRCFRPLRPEMRLAGGERIAARHTEWVVRHTPGHSAGHVCLYSEGQRLLISGDHVLEHITPNIGWMPGADSLGEYLASLDGLGALAVDWVLPSHGAPFRGLPEWIARTRQHHRERSQRILQAAAKPLTAHDVVQVLWPGELSHFHYRFALSEALAHLEHLRRQGALALDEGEPQYWRRMS